jgi:signal transduction histidine kinase
LTYWPKALFTDVNRLKQIVINLVSNAIKHTMEGYIRIYSEIDVQKQNLAIVFEDSGVGIDKKQLDNLFRAFTKIMHHRELNKDGVGLGLAISKNIARALGGDIDVVSVVGEGSKFILNIPLSP